MLCCDWLIAQTGGWYRAWCGLGVPVVLATSVISTSHDSSHSTLKRRLSVSPVSILFTTDRPTVNSRRVTLVFRFEIFANASPWSVVILARPVHGHLPYHCPAQQTWILSPQPPHGDASSIRRPDTACSAFIIIRMRVRGSIIITTIISPGAPSQRSRKNLSHHHNQRQPGHGCNPLLQIKAGKNHYTHNHYNNLPIGIKH